MAALKREALLVALLVAAGCAHARPRIEAHLDATPAVTIAGQVVTLHAWLADPFAAVRCPGITWTWPDGTRSSDTEDCDPDERETRHSDFKQGALPSGVYRFGVAFDFEGHRWSAGIEVNVH